MTTITDRRMPCGRAISILSLAVWWAKLEKNDKVSHNMTQIASLLVVAGLWSAICAFSNYNQRRGAYMRDKLPMQELEVKMRGGGGLILHFSSLKLNFF